MLHLITLKISKICLHMHGDSISMIYVSESQHGHAEELILCSELSLSGILSQSVSFMLALSMPSTAA